MKKWVALQALAFVALLVIVAIYLSRDNTVRIFNTIPPTQTITTTVPGKNTQQQQATSKNKGNPVIVTTIAPGRPKSVQHKAPIHRFPTTKTIITRPVQTTTRKPTTTLQPTTTRNQPLKTIVNGVLCNGVIRLICPT